MNVVLSFPDVSRSGGVERVVRETSRYLAERGHHVGLLTRKVDDITKDQRGVTHHAVPEVRRWSRGSLSSFAHGSAGVFDRISSETDVHGSFCTASPAGGVLWVQAVHRVWIELSKRQRSWSKRCKQKLNPFHRVALRLENETIGNRKYSKLIALTPVVADDLRTHYGVPQKDIVVLPNGVSGSEFACADAVTQSSARAKLGIAASEKVVLFMANETDRKGFVPLLLSIASLPAPRPHLLAVGQLGGLARWGSLIRKLGLNDTVTFTGPTNDVSGCYAASDVFALPTIYEAWGLVIVEALASGLPVLTSRLAGAAEAVQEGDTGYLLDAPHDVREIREKLLLLLRDDQPSGIHVSQSVERYDWKHILGQYEQILTDCAR